MEPITIEEELLLTKFLLNWLSLDKESENCEFHINDYKRKYWNCKIELFKKVILTLIFIVFRKKNKFFFSIYKKNQCVCKIDEESKLFRKIVEFLPSKFDIRKFQSENNNIVDDEVIYTFY